MYLINAGDKNLLEGVQRRITRIPFGIRRPSYEQRLSLINLPTVAYRQLRGDIITTFLAVTNIGSPINHIYVLNVGTKTHTVIS